jgi:5-methyltetrahydrofolate corrinoid/iron sulfur protein methyltransferase
VEIVHKVQDGEITDPSQVEGEELQVFVRAARVILGHTLYSDSWMKM